MLDVRKFGIHLDLFQDGDLEGYHVVLIAIWGNNKLIIGVDICFGSKKIEEFI
jgi:hypothetical protein